MAESASSPKNAPDPAVNAAVVSEFVRRLAVEPPTTLFAWMTYHLPEGSAPLQSFFLAVADEAGTAGLGAQAMAFADFAEQSGVRLMEVRQALFDSLSDEDPIGKLRAALADVLSQGWLPEDWETREGNFFCAFHWREEAFSRYEEALDFQLEGDLPLYYAWLDEAVEAARTSLDRALTLPREERDLLAHAASELCNVLENRREQLDPLPD